MENFKQSFAWWSFIREGADADAILSAAAEMGYLGVDLVPQERWAQVKKHGLAVSSINGHAAIQDGLNRVENRERIVRELTANILLAIRENIPNLICFSGRRYEIAPGAAQTICAETLAAVAGQAEQAGVTLALETLNSKVDHPGYDGDHIDWVVKVVEQVNSPRVKALYDIYHLQIMEGDLIRSIQKYHPHIAHYHTAGNPGRADLDETQEIQYPPIIRAIADTGYDGFICHEFIPKGDPVQALRAAYQLCDVG